MQMFSFPHKGYDQQCPIAFDMCTSVFDCFFFVFPRHANDVLKNETTMFEKYLKRVDPKDIGLQQASE